MSWRSARAATKIELAAKISGYTVGQITGESRDRDVCEIRWATMWAIRERHGYSLKRIGRIFGGRDHSTVIYGLRRAREMREIPAYAALCRAIADGDRLMTAADIGVSPDWRSKPMTPADLGLTTWPRAGDAILSSDFRELRTQRRADQNHLRALAKHHGMGIYAEVAA